MHQEHKKTVWIFAIASFLHDAGSDIVFSVWPLFLTEVLGANMEVLGFIDGLGEAVVSISQAVAGYISDRIRKRKIFVWLGYLLGGLARIGYAISPTWQSIVPFRVLDRSGKIRSSPRDAIISDVSLRETRGGNFGLLQAMDNLGAIVGIMIAIFLIPIFGYRKMFFLAAIPSVLAVLLIVFFIKKERPSDKKIYKGIRLKDLSKNLKLFFFLSAVFGLGSFTYSFLLIFAKRFGFTLTQIPLLYLLFTVTAAIVSVPFGKLSDKIGRKNLLFLALFFWALVPVLFIFFKSFLGIALAFLFYGLHEGAIDPSQKALVAELAPKEYVASTLGGFQMVIGLFSLPASLLAGILWDKIGIATPFYFSLFLTIIAAFLLIFVKEKQDERQQ